MSGADRARRWRDQRTALGLCHRCPAPAVGHYCVACARSRSPHQQVGYITRKFLVVMDLLSQNRCVECGQPKDRFDPWRHRKCAERKGRAA